MTPRTAPELGRAALLALLVAVGLVPGAACGSDGSSAADAADAADTADAAPDCGGCPDGKVCCASHFTGDIPRCVDTALNPENCGGCGTSCDGACEDGGCVAAPACDGSGATTCPGDLTCSSGGGQGRCCPPGTTFIVSPADFFGCCPDGDICGCREGMCPISLRAAKNDIRYLDPAAVEALGRELLATRLATWVYKGSDARDPRRQLGFIIDDGAPAHGIDGGHVDLYGYVSVAVAALQTQARELGRLEREVDALRARLERLERAMTAP